MVSKGIEPRKKKRVHNAIRRTRSELIFDIINAVVMVGIVIIMLFPFYDVIINSVAAKKANFGPIPYPTKFSLDAYRLMFSYSDLWSAYLVTIVRSVCVVFLHVVVSSMAAYSLSKKWLPLNSILTKLLLFTMLFSGGLIPTYMLYRDLGLLNTFSVLVLPGLVSAYNVLIIRNFYSSIPDSLEESASLDGAGWITIWLRIILPLCKPVLATVALWLINGVWNDWFAPAVYVNSGKYIVIQQILRKFVVENDKSGVENVMKILGQSQDRFSGRMLQSATILAASIPILIAYPFVQKYFTQGMLIGSVKG